MNRINASTLKTPRMRGVELHAQIIHRNRGFYQDVVKARLGLYEPFFRIFEGMRIQGKPDDYASDGHKVSIIEIYTTSMKTIDTHIIDKKIFQLQVYIWVMTPLIIKVGLIPSLNHWLEVYEQDTLIQLERIMVIQRDDFEDELRKHIDEYRFRGFEKKIE